MFLVFSTLAWQRCEYNTTTTTSPNITTHGWMEICLSCTSAIAAWYAGLSFSSPHLRSVLHHVVIFTQIHSLIWYFLSHLSQINIQRCSVGKCVCVESSRVMFSELNKLGESGSLSLFQHKCNRMLISVTVRVSKRRIIGCLGTLLTLRPFSRIMLHHWSVSELEFCHIHGSQSFQFLGLTSETTVT